MVPNGWGLWRATNLSGMTISAMLVASVPSVGYFLVKNTKICSNISVVEQTELAVISYH